MFYNMKQHLIVGAVAVVALVSSVSAAPVATPAGSSISARGFGDVYTNYRGNGSPEAGWPTSDKWTTFDEMWANNAAMMARSCNDEWLTTPGGKPGNSPHEMDVLRQAILSKAGEGGIDPRIVLAVVLQESRVHSTNNGVYNPGLMQAHAGLGDCQYINGPCPDEQIWMMVQDGAIGTAAGAGLSQILNSGTSAPDFYHAARVYNSGSVAPSGDLADGNGSTACYSSDVANRLTGWVYGPSSC